jgi:hypothetical protein
MSTYLFFRYSWPYTSQRRPLHIFRRVVLRLKLIIQFDRVFACAGIAFREIHHFLLDVRERYIFPSRLFSPLLHERVWFSWKRSGLDSRSGLIASFP